jgi:hypothetical protein
MPDRVNPPNGLNIQGEFVNRSVLGTHRLLHNATIWWLVGKEPIPIRYQSFVKSRLKTIHGDVLQIDCVNCSLQQSQAC